MASLVSLVGAVVLVAAVFLGSGYLGARTIGRAVRQTVERGEPLPRIARYWERVLRYGPWLGGGAAALMGIGVWLFVQGATETGQALVVVGAAVGSYVLQAAIIAGAIGKASSAREPHRER